MVPVHEIEELKNHFTEQFLPVGIYLFDSSSNNTNMEERDLDFYIMLSDGVSDLAAETAKAYKAIRKAKNHPVDIIVETKSRVDARKGISSVEKEVYSNGVLLYDAGNERMV